MKKWGGTSILIIILLILTLLGAINYFATPVKKWQMANDQSQVVLPQKLDVAQENTAEPSVRLVDKLADSEVIWQVLAVPVEVDDQLMEVSRQNVDQTTNQGLDEIESIVKSQVGLATESGELGKSDKQNLLGDGLIESLPATAPGALVIFGDQISTSSASSFSQLVDSTYATRSAQPWLVVDHEGGTVQRLRGQGFTTLPSWRRICQLSPSTQLELANTTSLEIKNAGIDLVLAPVIDVATSSAVLSSRVCSGDPELVASTSAIFINSYLQAGILPVIKHFPGIGSVEVDLHKQFGAIAVQSTDVMPFHSLLSQFPTLGVMTTHISPEKDSQTACSRDYSCVSELTSLYPKTLVISDALDMKSALYNSETQTYDTPLPQVALEAILAGNDLLLFGPAVSLDEINQIATYLQFAADNDPDIKGRIEVAADKILSYKEIYSKNEK